MNFDILLSGKSALGKDIPVYKNSKNHPQYLYLMAGTHGDEPESVYVLGELFKWLKTTDFHHLPMIVIPALNPDGLELKTRTNGNKVDLNRNYPTANWKGTADQERYFPGPHPLSEPENQLLSNLFDTYKPAFVLTFHCWKPLIDYDGDALDMARFISERNAYPVTDYIGYPTPGSFGTWMTEKYKCSLITYELPENIGDMSMEKIWLENEKPLKDLFLHNQFDRYL